MKPPSAPRSTARAGRCPRKITPPSTPCRSTTSPSASRNGCCGDRFAERISAKRVSADLERRITLALIRPEPAGGTFRDRHDALGTGCDGRCGVRRVHSRRTKTSQRTAKSCGPGAATLALRRRDHSRRQRGQERPLSRGEYEGNCKTIWMMRSRSSRGVRKRKTRLRHKVQNLQFLALLSRSQSRCGLSNGLCKHEEV